MSLISNALASNRPIALAAVITGLLLALPAAASADNGRTVIQFKGDNAKTFRKQVKKIVKGADYRVVKTSAYTKAAKKLGATGINDGNVKKVAGKKNLVAVIFARSRKSGSGYEVTLSVRLGKTGEEVNEITLNPSGDKLSSADLARLRNELVPALEGRRVEAPVAGDDDDDDKPKGDDDDDKPKGDDDDDDDKPKGDDDDDDDKPKGDDDDDDGSTPLLEGRRLPWLEISAGLGLNRRVFNYAVDGDLGDARPEDYTNGVAPMVSLNIEGYPLARDPKTTSITSRLGAEINLDQVVLFRSVVVMQDTEAELSTTHRQLRFNAVYRQPLMAGKLVVKGKAGYVFKKFKIDEGNSTVFLPDVNYRGIDVSVAASYALNDKMQINVDGGYLLLLKAGPVSNADQYGGGSQSGYHFGGSFGYGLMPNVAVRAGVEAVLVNLSFDGDGELSDPNNDMNPDVTGANEVNIWAFARGVYEFK